MGVHVSAEAITFERLRGEHAEYRVELPALRCDGRVVISAERHAAGGAEAWIAQRLDALAVSLGFNAACGRLYSPVDLEEASGANR